jgi:hypothetical protein
MISSSGVFVSNISSQRQVRWRSANRRQKAARLKKFLGFNHKLCELIEIIKESFTASFVALFPVLTVCIAYDFVNF